MFIIDFFKTLGTIKKAKKFVNEHQDKIEEAKVLVDKVQTGIANLEGLKNEIQEKIETAKTTISKITGLFK